MINESALKSHEVTFWVTLLVPWGAALFVYIAAMVMGVWWVGEVYHHVTLALPLASSHLARRVVVDRARSTGRCLVAGPAPVWALAAAGGSGLVTLLLHTIIVESTARSLGYLTVFPFGLGIFAVPLGLRLVGNSWWLHRCKIHLDQIGYLTAIEQERHPISFAVNTRVGPRYVEVVALDDRFAELRTSDDGTTEVWHVLTPDERVARAFARQKRAERLRSTST